MMLTPKENLFETLKINGKPDRLVSQYEPFKMLRNDPLSKFTRGNRKMGQATTDVWGTLMVWPEGQPAAIPYITSETKVLPDVTRWRDYVTVPDLAANCADWTEALEAAAAVDREKYLVMGHMGTGIFEQCHFLMGFEDTLTNLLLEPESMHEVVDAIGEYRFLYAKLLIEHLRPDAVISNDDWGNKTSLFMRPEVWREFFKPQYERIYGYMKEQGVMVVHHADSFLEPLVEDMVDLGIDIWQGVLPTNDIPRLQKQLGGRMTLMGGIDSLVDRPDATEEEIRAEARRACAEYGGGGYFIPCITYGADKTIHRRVYEILSDEIGRFNEERNTRI